MLVWSYLSLAGLPDNLLIFVFPLCFEVCQRNLLFPTEAENANQLVTFYAVFQGRFLFATKA